MHSPHVLYLASNSAARKQLLQDSCIPFTVIKQTADETLCNWNLPLEQLVLEIALLKMEHIALPKGHEGETCYVLTADTLGSDQEGTVHAKPINKQDALKKLQLLSLGTKTATAFCLDKKIFINGEWQLLRRVTRVVTSECIFEVPVKSLSKYLEKSGAMQASGAIAIEQYGLQFLKEIQGSYTAILGLPLFEVRQALEELGFFNS